MTDYVNELDSVCLFDLETSGTDQNNDQILEVCAIFGKVDADGFHGSVTYNRTLPLITDPDKWDPIVQIMHNKNGLLAEARELAAQVDRPDGSVNIHRSHFAEVDADLARIAEGSAKWALMGNTVHFDLGFARRVFPEFAKHLSHRVLDVSGVRLLCQSLGMPYPGKADPAHRAKDDCLLSADLFKGYQQWLRDNGYEGQL
jgi:oligoribonuclease (3'-5' exoribonuclease)